MLNKTSSYEIKLNKAICGGVRNFDCYYVVVKQQGNSTKYISKAMRNDEDNEDYLRGEIQIKPTAVQLWNYDKMKLVEAYPVNFKLQPSFTWTNYTENMELSVRHVPPETKTNTKVASPSNAETPDVDRSKAGSQKNIEISVRREKSKAEDTNTVNELNFLGILPPLPKREE